VRQWLTATAMSVSMVDGNSDEFLMVDGDGEECVDG
jgi:hypothetical protein